MCESLPQSICLDDFLGAGSYVCCYGSDSFPLLHSLQYFPLNLPTFYPNSRPLIFVFKAALLSHSSIPSTQIKCATAHLICIFLCGSAEKGHAVGKFFQVHSYGEAFSSSYQKKKNHNKTKQKKPFHRGTGQATQLIEHLPSMQEALGLISSTA